MRPCHGHCDCLEDFRFSPFLSHMQIASKFIKYLYPSLQQLEWGPKRLRHTRLCCLSESLLVLDGWNYHVESSSHSADLGQFSICLQACYDLKWLEAWVASGVALVPVSLSLSLSLCTYAYPCAWSFLGYLRHGTTIKIAKNGKTQRVASLQPWSKPWRQQKRRICQDKTRWGYQWMWSYSKEQATKRRRPSQTFQNDATTSCFCS